MDATVIHSLVFTKPFLPFTLTMIDGREFYVRHPELISVAVTHVYVIDDRTDRGIFLEPALIALVQQDENRSEVE